MSTQNQISKHWQFWLQLALILFACGGAWNAFQAQSKELTHLQELHNRDTETLIRLQNDADWIKKEINNLRERLELKKIVNVLGETPPVVGERHISP